MNLFERIEHANAKDRADALATYAQLLRTPDDGSPGAEATMARCMRVLNLDGETVRRHASAVAQAARLEAELNPAGGRVALVTALDEANATCETANAALVVAQRTAEKAGDALSDAQHHLGCHDDAASTSRQTIATLKANNPFAFAVDALPPAPRAREPEPVTQLAGQPWPEAIGMEPEKPRKGGRCIVYGGPAVLIVDAV